MATRMQQRRGTASQWTSTNAGAGPVLNAGEIGWESDTNRFKIGDGVNNWSSLDYFADINSTVNPSFGTSITFEGATADSYETTLQVTDPTADRTITFPNATGTVVLADGSGNVTVSGDLTVSGTTTTINSTTINATTGIIFEGLTADAFETTLTVTDPTADRTITFQDATGTVVLRDSTDTLTNKSISLGSNTVTSTLAQLNTAISDADVASLAGSETLTNKTLTTPVISSITNGAATLTLPTSTGTIALTTDIPSGVVTETGTQTLTNKTLTSPKINEDVAVIATATELNYVDGVTSAIQTQLDAKAPAASPTFTGTVVLPSTVNGPGASTSVNLLFPTTSGNITLGGSQTTGNLTIGGGTQRTTGVIGIGTGATTTGTKTISIGTGSTGGTTAITVGSADGATSNITLNGTVTAANNLVVTGDLTVNGTTTTINSTTLAVDDKNIVLGDVATPSDTTADGGGITLKGATDKTLNWVDATDAWTSSEHINLASGKSYSINGTALKDVSETLTNKSISFGSNTVTSTLAQLNTAISDADVASLAGSETLTNKTVALGSNTVSGTLAQFNTAVTDADFASLAGTETFTNKSISMTTNTITGTFAEFNSAVTDHDLVSLTSTSTLTNKTLTSPIITGLTLNDSSIVFEGATADSFETTLTVTDPTADRTLTLPDATGTLLSTALFSAKGAILVGTGTGTFTTQSVGANGSVLTADSNEADGVKWVAASGGASFSELMLIGA
jgi:hypothetical protein